jgi:flagellar biosynthesis/type III secretory pathway M-ring protein FliF/YscJ
MTLSAEEKRQIYEQEKVRIEAEKCLHLIEKLTRAKSRFSRKQLLVASGLFAAITGSIAWYIHWIHSPEYSLLQRYRRFKNTTSPSFKS